MGGDLTTDEFDALQQIVAGIKHARPSACVARNTKRLTGLKYIAYAKAVSYTHLTLPTKA